MTHFGSEISKRRMRVGDVIYIVPSLDQIMYGELGFVVACTVIKAMSEELGMKLKFFSESCELGWGAKQTMRVLELTEPSVFGG